MQINTIVKRGGAARVVASLHEGYLARGIDSWIAVGFQEGEQPQVITVPNASSRPRYRQLLERLALKIEPESKAGLGASTVRGLRAASDPVAAASRWWGLEDFSFPGTRELLGLLPGPPQIIHGHNLHGSYFDLREMPALSQIAPMVLTLHDSWLLTGHCAHSFSCMRWRTGCGHCPDLTIYPAIRRDATATNWRRKRAIFNASQVSVIAPSQWMMERVEQSQLYPAVRLARVIPNGVDVDVFRPGSRSVARAGLGLPEDGFVVCSVGDNLSNSRWRDGGLLDETMRRFALDVAPKEVVLVLLGGASGTRRDGNLLVVEHPYEHRMDKVADYYRAADIYLHVSVADTFSTTILEALACGAIVIATNVGGIPEQIKNLDWTGEGLYVAEVATGIVTEMDAERLSAALSLIFKDPGLRRQLSHNARLDAVSRFSLDRQVDAYLDFYSDVLAHTN